MDDDLRARLREAIDAEQLPADLRGRVLAGVNRRRAGLVGGPRRQWIGAVAVAGFLVIGFVAGGGALLANRAGNSSGRSSLAGPDASPSVTSTPGTTGTAEPTSGARPAVTRSPMMPSSRTSGAAGASPAPAPYGACSPATGLQLTTTTSKASYLPGETVTISTSATNLSSQACSYVFGCTRPTVRVEASNGDVVWSSLTSSPGGQRAAQCMSLGNQDLAPGATSTYSFDWKQMTCRQSDATCPAGPAPSGNYLTRGEWEEGEAAPAAFRLGS